MNIKATFPAGVTALTVHGLHQWDYGRVLEISHPDLPAVAEVHFAAISSKEAIVHTVAGVNGVATAAIPNILLEQMSPITAWVYYVGETSGETMLTVTLPVQARPRPAASPAVPEEISDKYTEALGAINEQVETLKGGNVMVANAAHATSADRAKEAETASMATMAANATFATSAQFAAQATKATQADSATSATSAGTAAKATKDSDGRTISTTYLRSAADFAQNDTLQDGVYLFGVDIFGTMCFAILPIVSGVVTQASLGFVDCASYVLRCGGNGKPKVMLNNVTAEMVESEAIITAKQIFNC